MLIPKNQNVERLWSKKWKQAKQNNLHIIGSELKVWCLSSPLTSHFQLHLLFRNPHASMISTSSLNQYFSFHFKVIVLYAEIILKKYSFSHSWEDIPIWQRFTFNLYVYSIRCTKSVFIKKQTYLADLLLLYHI